jgi:hypothetical protein
MRTALLIVALGGFACLALIDLSHGRTDVGAAELMLAAANYLLLV